MPQNKDQVEKLILHAIAIWQEHMAALCYQEEDKHKYPYCPKRFIYGCSCSFERKKIQQTLDEMVKNGAISQHDSPDHPSEISYKAA